MQPLNRRRALRLLGAGAGVSLAGCLGESDPGGGADGGAGDGGLEVDVFQAGATASRPPWAEVGDRVGFVRVIESLDDVPLFATADDGDDGDGGPRPPEDLVEWFEETDFEASVVVSVQTAAPNACYRELEIDDVGTETVTFAADDDEGDGVERIEAITGTAAAVDVREDEAEGCAQVETYPAAYVRVTGEDLPSAAAFTITNGWGDAGEVRSDEAPIRPDDLAGYVEPPHDPQNVPAALECDDEAFERLPATGDDEVAWGETVDDDGDSVFAMRVENPQYDGDADDVDRALAFERGDEVRIALRNVSDDRQSTGNRHKYNLEILTEDGWEDVRGADPDARIGYTDEGLLHPPGRGFEWTFELSEEGLVEGHAHEDAVRVCPDLHPGRYRFRFWSVAGADSIAVAFDLVA
ncbi:hypothetical protein [Halovivax sp.]|uniref:hypothetical protein n=1 Tax=Halovivax sp. TaxID=1935978 RepID=UPI0025BB9910|nr:hypothetical protein [Halovivax sp.]